MSQDIKILKKNADFIDITSLNTFIKNTKMFHNYMAITNLKKRGKGYVAYFKISKKNIDFLDMTFLNTFVKVTKNIEKYLALPKKQETFMLQDIQILKKNADFVDITSLNTFIINTIICPNYMAVTDLEKVKKLCCKFQDIEEQHRFSGHEIS